MDEASEIGRRAIEKIQAELQQIQESGNNQNPEYRN